MLTDFQNSSTCTSVRHKVCNKVVIKVPATPRKSRYTTLYIIFCSQKLAR